MHDRVKKQPSNMHAEDVKAAIRKICGSMSNLARDHNVSTSVIRAALIRPQPTGNRIIAARLGKSVHELWPEWFDESGARIRGNSTSARRRRHRQNRETA